MKKFTFSFILFLLSSSIFAVGGNPSKGYDIKINIKSLANTPLILAYYFGDKQYIKDTFEFDKNGVCTIKADTALDAGIYLAVFPKMNNKYFEFLVNEQKFSLTTDTNDLAMKMAVSGSQENKLFYEDMHFLKDKRDSSEKYSKLYRDEKDEKQKEVYKNALKKLDDEVKAKRQSVISTYPTTFYAKVLKSMKDIEVPEAPRDAKGALIDSSWAWRFYKAHYWDNFDLNDDRLLKTPILNNKLKDFYTRVIIQNPDSLIVDGDALLQKMNPKGDIFKYTLVYMLNEMAKSKIMGFDAVYVHIVNTYYAKGYATWVDSTQLYKINERGRILAPLLIGKQAMNINLTDTTLKNFKSIYDIKSRFTVLCFWDPDCGHCKKEVPKLAEAYHKMKTDKIDMAVYAPSIMSIEEMKKWTDFIHEHNLDWINVADPYHQNNFRFEWDIQSTPQIYVLDKDKKIIAKRIGAEQVEDFIRHEIDPSYKPKSPPVMLDSQEEVH